MKRRTSIWSGAAVMALAIGALASRALADDAKNPTGTWKWSFTTQGGQTFESAVRLKLDDGKLTGVYIGRQNTETPIEEGKFKDGEVSFQVTRERDGQKFTSKYKGKIDKDTIKGTMEGNFGGQNRTRDWEAKREKKAG